MTEPLKIGLSTIYCGDAKAVLETLEVRLWTFALVVLRSWGSGVKIEGQIGLEPDFRTGHFKNCKCFTKSNEF